MNHAKGRKCREDRLSPIIGTLNFLGMKFEANLSLFFSQQESVSILQSTKQRTDDGKSNRHTCSHDCVRS